LLGFRQLNGAQQLDSALSVSHAAPAGLSALVAAALRRLPPHKLHDLVADGGRQERIALRSDLSCRIY
jgi:hypothetical protein